MTQYIVFDNNGIIHSSTILEDAEKEFDETEEFDGDLHLVQELAVRR